MGGEHKTRVKYPKSLLAQCIKFEKMRNAYKMFVIKPQRKKTISRKWNCRCEDNKKILGWYLKVWTRFSWLKITSNFVLL